MTTSSLQHFTRFLRELRKVETTTKASITELQLLMEIAANPGQSAAHYGRLIGKADPTVSKTIARSSLFEDVAQRGAKCSDLQLTELGRAAIQAALSPELVA